MIRRKIFTSFCVFTLALLLFSCDNKGGSHFSADNRLKFDTLNITKVFHLEGDTANPSCNLSIHFAYPVESKIMNLTDLQQIFIGRVFGTAFDTLSVSAAIDAYVNNYIDNYKLDASIYRNNSEEIDEEEIEIGHHYLEDDDNSGRPKIFYSYFENLSDTIYYNSHNILSFQVKQSNHKDHTEAYHTYRNCVVNLKSGTVITENDIFNPGYDLALRKLFIASLLEQNGVKSVQELEDSGYFGIEEIMPNRNFLITKEGITYTFNRGEYSAYQLKSPVIFIPFEQMTAILKESTVVSKLEGL